MVTSFSQFTPIEVKKIIRKSQPSGKVKKSEAKTKQWFSYKNRCSELITESFQIVETATIAG